MTPNFLNLTLLAVPGAALWLAVRVLREADSRSGLVQCLRAATVMCFVVTAFGFAAGMLLLSSFFLLAGPLLIFCSVLVGRTQVRLRHGEDAALLSGLATAAEQRVPLVEMATAFAAEGRGRSQRLQRALAAGQPLIAALRDSFIRPSASARAALAVGETRGDLGLLLQHALAAPRSIERAVKTMTERFLLWLAAFPVLLIVVTITTPMYMKMFEEFGVKLPEATVWWTHFVQDQLRPVTPLLLILSAAAFVALMLPERWQRGLLPFYVRRRYDAAAVLHALAAGTSCRVPLTDLISAIAATYDYGPVAWRLRKIAEDCNRGGETWDAFRRHGLLTAKQAKVLHSAERVGDLPFALRELSWSLLRQLDARLSFWTGILAPLGTALLGFGGLMTAVGLLIPLFALTQGLSRG